MGTSIAGLSSSENYALFIDAEKHPKQQNTNILHVYKAACAVKRNFDRLLKDLSTAGIDVKVLFSKLKKPYRIVEKMTLRQDKDLREDASSICDIVRGSLVCNDFRSYIILLKCLSSMDDGMEESTKLPEALEKWKSKIRILRIKDRFDTPTSGGWSDLMFNLILIDDQSHHVCELQVHHAQLLNARSEYAGHKDYALFRCALEILETIGEEVPNTACELDMSAVQSGIPRARPATKEDQLRAAEVHIKKSFGKILGGLQHELNKKLNLDHKKLQFEELINQAQDIICVENWEDLSKREKVMALASEMGVV